MHSAAPSPTPLAFPAVVDAAPQSGKEGFSAASPSALTFGRTVSSADTTVPRNSMGRISLAKMPPANACAGCFCQSPRTRARKKNEAREGRDLCCARMRNERVLVLLLPRDVVRLSDHFRGPPHRLPERNHCPKLPPRSGAPSVRTWMQSCACGFALTVSSTTGVGRGLRKRER
jgi:hypothetical protein